MSGWIFLLADEVGSTAMLQWASPDEAVSARGYIAIRYRSSLRSSKEHDFYRADLFYFPSETTLKPPECTESMEIAKMYEWSATGPPGSKPKPEQIFI
jgi:hypothetical protein